MESGGWRVKSRGKEEEAELEHDGVGGGEEEGEEASGLKSRCALGSGKGKKVR